MKKENLISKAEMKNVMGGLLPVAGDCDNECTVAGASCTRNGSDGTCTSYTCGSDKTLYCMNGGY